MQSYKKFICTRALLASKLLEEGFAGNRTVNPYHTNRIAWTFDFSVPLATTVLEFYESIGERPPKIITDYLQQNAPQPQND